LPLGLDYSGSPTTTTVTPRAPHCCAVRTPSVQPCLVLRATPALLCVRVRAACAPRAAAPRPAACAPSACPALRACRVPSVPPPDRRQDAARSSARPQVPAPLPRLATVPLGRC